MNSEIIAIGDEVVKGYTINTNASYIAKRMQEIGIDVIRHTAVCDCQEAIIQVLEGALRESELIWVIGGLGPTDDDLTKETVCKALNKPLNLQATILQDIEMHFARTGRTTPSNNRKQAYFPDDAIILPNPNGTAPGCILEADNAALVLLPGPPKELMPMVEDYVVPYLMKKVRKHFYRKDIRVFGIGESHLAEKLGGLLGVCPEGSVATYVGNDEIVVRIHIGATTKEDANQKGEAIEEQIAVCLKDYIIGYNDKQLEENVVDALKRHRYTIATAESCTGGMVASTLINCGGISEWLRESIVTYSNDAKMKYLGVKEETLKTYGAVSAQTAREMAQGIQKQAKTTIGLATTGIAGPDGGTPTKPVGTVYIGIAIEEACYTYHLQLDGSRQEIRQKTVKHILHELYKYLQKDSTCN